MAVKTREELMNCIKDKTKDDTADDTLAFIEDMNDTFNDYETKLHDTTDWKQKYEDNDKQWRQKYRDRFFNGTNDSQSKESDEDSGQNENESKKTPRTFADLFKFSKTKPKE